MSFEITGTLVKKYETETKGESFRVRDFVIKANDGGQYDNFVKFQCTQDRTTIVDDLNEGDEIKVHFDLRGREWQGRYFTNLNAWRVENISAAGGVGTSSEETFNDFPSAGDEPSVSADDDLPF
jgi:single-strand DNA-binding protein